MKVSIITVLLAGIIIPVVYFTVFENLNVSFFRADPKELVEVVVNALPEDEAREPEEFVELLENIDQAIAEVEQDNANAPQPKPEVTAEYSVEFVGTWSRQTHPGYFAASNAHFSPAVVWSHNDRLSVFEVGEVATPGIEKVAELGGTATLEQELDMLTERDGLRDYVVGKKFDTPGSSVQQVTVSENFPLLTLISMIAPSPDWFVAVENVELYQDGQWIDSVRLDTVAYDAGTEEGDRFTISNPATEPSADIDVLRDIPSENLEPFGYVVITKIN